MVPQEGHQTSTLTTETNSPYTSTSRNHSSGNYFSGLDGVDIRADAELARALALFVGGVALIILLLRIWQLFSSHLRHIYCLAANRAQQNYWSYDRSRVLVWLNRELIYAPLFKKRYNKELRISAASNYGTIPSRLQTLLLMIYFVGNVAFCAWLDYRRSKPALLAELRGRSGMLASVNMVPLVIFAARNNLAIPILKLSYNEFNLAHRWLGRITFLESTIHVLAWWGAYSAKGQHTSRSAFKGVPFLQFGLTAVVLMSVMMIQSLSAIRHAYYECFKALHSLLAFFVMLGVLIHLQLALLPALPYIRAAIILWILERSVRLGQLLYLNHARKASKTQVTVEVLPAEALRLTFQLPRHITVNPGSHCYVTLPSIEPWTSHPFSVAWTSSDSEPLTGAESDAFLAQQPTSPTALEKQEINLKGRASISPTTLSMVVAARTGFTRKMYNLAKGHAASGVTLDMSAYLEGPFGGNEDLSSYGTVLFFAGGVGITHHLSQVRHLIARGQAYTVATRRIVLVWSVKDSESLSWIQPWMTEILQMPMRRSMLKVLLYVSRAQNPVNYRSPGHTLSTFGGRCDPGAILDQELPERVGATMVSCCGPGSFADEVRASVRARMHLATIDFNEEAFTW